MSFHKTARNISIQDNHILVAELEDQDGNLMDASIDLNTCIGNWNGDFEWGGVNFSHSAYDVKVTVEQNGQLPLLRAELRNGNGNQSFPTSINLSERIANSNGQFEFKA